MFKQSQMSRDEYVLTVEKYYKNVVIKDFEESFC